MPGDVESAIIGSIGAVVVAASTYLLNKRLEREAEWRKEKLEHYKAFVGAVSGIMAGEGTPDGQKAFAKACNDLHLVAPSFVVKALREYQYHLFTYRDGRIATERHNQLLAALFLAMRKDLKITGFKQDVDFSVEFMSAGVSEPTIEAREP